MPRELFVYYRAEVAHEADVTRAVIGMHGALRLEIASLRALLATIYSLPGTPSINFTSSHTEGICRKHSFTLGLINAIPSGLSA